MRMMMEDDDGWMMLEDGGVGGVGGGGGVGGVEG